MTKHVDVLASDDAPVPVRAPGHDGTLSGTPCVGTDNGQAERWRQIARSLGACDGQWEQTTERMLRRARLAEYLAASERCSDNAKIEVLDRPTAVSAVLSWRDSTGGSYGYQIWQKRVARRAGTCAMSGSPIRCGDHIYSPAASPRRSNAAAMILATYIDRPHPARGISHA